MAERVGPRRRIGLVLALAALVPLLATGRGDAAPVAVSGPVRPGDAMGHLDQILARSPAPEYRRLGSPGIQAAADYAAGVLARAGYIVRREDLPGTVYRPDYRPGHAPSLVRLGDGQAFRTETAFNLGKTTPATGITCVVRAVADVRKGDCGFIPFQTYSPEWKNTFFVDSTQVDAVISRGGVGVVLQGDLARKALVATSVRRPIPAVVSLARPEDLVGQRVRLRTMGAAGPTTIHDVIAVRPPKDPAKGYTLVQGHLDGWFAAAVDNGGGAATVLAVAERMATVPTDRGLLVALYDGEEWGLQGSKGFARDLGDRDGVAMAPCGPTVHLHDIVSVVNLDAPSAQPSDLTGIVQEVTGSPQSLISWRAFVYSEEPVVLADFVASMAVAGVIGLPLPVSIVNPFLGGGMDRTDGKWFHEAGIPVAWPVAEYPEYHTTADVRDRVDPADLRRLVAGVAILVGRLDDAAVTRISGSLPAPGTRRTPDARC